MADTLVEFDSVEFGYPGSDFRLAIDNLHVAARQRVAIVGPSGCGKSTCLHLIAGILSPLSGCIRVLDQDLTVCSKAARQDMRAREIGLVFQSFELLDYLNVADNLLLTYRVNRGLRITPQVRQRANALAKQLGIEAKLASYPRQLSQGERQRVAIGRALITQPRLLLADEPTGNLDPENKQRVLDLMLDQVEQRQIPLVMVTHDTQLLDQFDEVIDLQKRFLAGKVAGDATDA